MLDLRTRRLFRQMFSRPLTSVWKVARLLDVDVDEERRLRLLNSILALPPDERSKYAAEVEWIRNNISQNGFCPMFPYPMKTAAICPDVIETGKEEGCVYVIHRGKKLFFPKKWRSLIGAGPVESYVEYLSNEGLLGGGARRKSPHCYDTAAHHPLPDDVLLDVGCAEALYALHWIESVRKVYLFECERFWQKPLSLTFRPYADKAVFLRRIVGDGTNGSIRLSDAVTEPLGTRFFIKMDIEGAERFVIESSREFLTSNPVRMSVCCYHRQDDAEVLSRMLQAMGFKTGFSDGYMVPDMNGMVYPYFRRGVIYAVNY